MAKKPSPRNNKRKNRTQYKKSAKNKSPVKNLKKYLQDESSIFFNAIFENAGIGIIIGDESGKLLKVNRTFLNMLGYTQKQFLELSIKGITYPQDYAADAALFEELLLGKRNQYQTEKRFVTKDGAIIWGKSTVLLIGNNKKRKRFIRLIENVTEQKQIAGKLAEEQHQFITLLENSPDSIYFKDLEGRFVRASKATAKKLGFSQVKDLINKSDYDIFGHNHAREAYNDEQRVIKTGEPIIGKEEREDFPDGRITWASTTKMPLLNSEGEITGVFGITRDITERKLIEEKIRKNEELYRAMFENSADGMFLMTDVFLDCNQTVCRMFHCTREDIIGHSPVDFSPEVQPDGKNSLASATEKINNALKGIPQRFYWMHKTKDNMLIDAEVSLNAITISSQNLIQAVVRDITERTKSEKIRDALYNISEAAYTATDTYMLYEKIHKVVSSLMSTKNFYISLYNEKSGMISFPYFVDEFDPPQPSKKLGKGLTEYVLRKGSACLIDAETDKKLRASGEVELVGAPSAIWLGVPLLVEGKTIGVIVVQDYENEKAYAENEMQLLTFVAEHVAQVIEKKRTSDALRKYADELKQLNQTKDKFFSIIAHDLKNPFITIMGFSDLLLSDYEELSDQERLYYIEEMKKSADLSHNLLQNLLQWSRSQTGRIEFNPQPIDIKKIIDENIELLRGAAERKHICMQSNSQENLIVVADEDMLNTILRNLLTNALKFTNKHGVITAETRQLNSFVEIEVKDNGVGMPDNIRESLFRLDVSHSSPGTDNEAGTGLGLILCKEFVERNGGSISVESRVDRGTTFTFTLPIRE